MFPKIWEIHGKPPNHPILIGFSIIFTIHFGVPLFFGNTQLNWKIFPYLLGLICCWESSMDSMKFHAGCDTLQRGMVEVSGGTWTKTLSWCHRGGGKRSKRWYLKWWRVSCLYQAYWYINFTTFVFFKTDAPFDLWRFPKFDLWSAFYDYYYKL